MFSRRAVLLILAGLAGATAFSASLVPAHHPVATLAQALLDPRPAPPPQREMPVFARAEDDAAGLTRIGAPGDEAASVVLAYPDHAAPFCIHAGGVGIRLEEILFVYRLAGHDRFRL